MTEYRGRPLESYTKEELIKIVTELGQMLEQSSLEHLRQLKMLGGS